MTRLARQLSETGFYHVYFRGVNHCHLFEDDHDYNKMLCLLARIKDEIAIEVHAYCLMSNHVHLLIREDNPGQIILAMSKLLGPYARWFNEKYERSGALIANRYQSKPVCTDPYLVSLVRYIHQNGIEAGVVDRMEDYRWSSYSEYFESHPQLTETGFVLSVFSKNRPTALDEFRAFHAIPETEDYSTLGRVRRTEEQIHADMIQETGIANLNTITSMQKPQRDAIIVSLRKRGFTVRQIERATGVSRGTITRAQ